MEHLSKTEFAVVAQLKDGTQTPNRPEELDWFSLAVAKKIAGKAWEALNNTKNSQVEKICIINADYDIVECHGKD